MKIIKLSTNNDLRGSLTSVEGAMHVPFDIKRCYILHHLEGARGGHAHLDTQQLIIAVSGIVHVRLNNRILSRSFLLANPTVGLLINPMTWIEIPEFQKGSVVVVLADTHYNPSRTIRKWDEFISRRSNGKFTC